jgi:hypothetical protein
MKTFGRTKAAWRSASRRSPRRFAHTRQPSFAPASWSAPALWRFSRSVNGAPIGIAVADFKHMVKKVIIISSILLVVLIAIVGTRVVVRSVQQQRIVTVLNQANKARINATHIRILGNARSKANFSLKEYLAGIETISTAQCPENFRLAWLNYIQTLQREGAPLSGLGAVTEFEISTLKASPNGTKDALARLDKINGKEAWMNVETTALEYGVQLVRN